MAKAKSEGIERKTKKTLTRFLMHKWNSKIYLSLFFSLFCRMRNQLRLVVLLVFVTAYVTASLEPPHEKQNEIAKDETHKKAHNLIGALNPRYNKMIPLPTEKSSKNPKSSEKKDETSTIGNISLSNFTLSNVTWRQLIKRKYYFII